MAIITIYECVVLETALEKNKNELQENLLGNRKGRMVAASKSLFQTQIQLALHPKGVSQTTLLNALAGVMVALATANKSSSTFLQLLKLNDYDEFGCNETLYDIATKIKAKLDADDEPAKASEVPKRGKASTSVVSQSSEDVKKGEEGSQT